MTIQVIKCKHLGNTKITEIICQEVIIQSNLHDIIKSVSEWIGEIKLYLWMLLLFYFNKSNCETIVFQVFEDVLCFPQETWKIPA